MTRAMLRVVQKKDRRIAISFDLYQNCRRPCQERVNAHLSCPTHRAQRDRSGDEASLKSANERASNEEAGPVVHECLQARDDAPRKHEERQPPLETEARDHELRGKLEDCGDVCGVSGADWATTKAAHLGT